MSGPNTAGDVYLYGIAKCAYWLIVWFIHNIVPELLGERGKEYAILSKTIVSVQLSSEHGNWCSSKLSWHQAR